MTKEMVNKFLSWKLPVNFNPDAGITFVPLYPNGYNEPGWWPIGTNLLSADQAEEMFEFCAGEIVTSLQAQLAEREKEIERLKLRLKYQEDREGRIGTHDPRCHTYGPTHYECAMRVIAERNKTILEQQARNKELRILLGGEVKIALYYGQANINNSGCEEGSKLDETSKHLERVEGLVRDVLLTSSDNLSALEAALKAERIKTLEEAAKMCESLKVPYESYFEINERLDQCADAIRTMTD